jgi:hypothetical protein
MHAPQMFVKLPKGVRVARMSSGTWCLVRDLGLVKGGKGMRHFEPVVTFSFRALIRYLRTLLARQVADEETEKLQDLR